MKVVITGSDGFVAGSIIAQAPDHWEVHGTTRRETANTETGVIYHHLDLLDLEILEALIRELRPDAVIHAAAIANIDTCQTNQLAAEAINVGITESLSRICKETGSKLVFCSTDAVFDGTGSGYTETDKPRAVNFYAETKIQAEKIVLKASPENVVARLALVMGLPVIGAGNSFLSDAIEKLGKGEEIKFPNNETRTPVDVITLGSALIELANNDFGGIIHLAGSTSITRYEMAKQIARQAGFSENRIIPVDSNALQGRAPRSNNVSMSNALAKKVLKTPMRTLSEGLELTMSFKTKQRI